LLSLFLGWHVRLSCFPPTSNPVSPPERLLKASMCFRASVSPPPGQGFFLLLGRHSPRTLFLSRIVIEWMCNTPFSAVSLSFAVSFLLSTSSPFLNSASFRFVSFKELSLHCEFCCARLRLPFPLMILLDFFPPSALRCFLSTSRNSCMSSSNWCLFLGASSRSSAPPESPLLA